MLHDAKLFCLMPDFFTSDLKSRSLWQAYYQLEETYGSTYHKVGMNIVS